MKRIFLTLALVAGLFFGLTAQNSAPAPGSGGSFNPAPLTVGPGGGGGGNGPGGWGGPGLGPVGNPWGPGWNTYPTTVPNWQNTGVMNVIACGYDARGVWRTLPLRVSYYYNGVQYVVTVVNAWNPWTGVWNYGVDMPAYNTTYYLRGQTFDFYAPLSTGTYYFNL